MLIVPCHVLFHIIVREDKLTCIVTQRSADVFLGLPFNIASYAMLTNMIAQVCNLQPKELIIAINDAHIYLNHIDQMKTQLRRKPYKPPSLRLNPDIMDIDDFREEDISLINYQSHSALKGELAV